jgi:hypothetical protein
MAAGWDAAPAGGARNPAPGRPRVAVRPHYEGPPLCRAGRVRARAGESRPAREGEESSAQWPEARPRGLKKPRWSAVGRARRRTTCPRLEAQMSGANGAHLFARRGLKLGASRRSIPSPVAGAKGPAPRRRGKTAYPAPPRIRAAELCVMLRCERSKPRSMTPRPSRPVLRTGTSG